MPKTFLHFCLLLGFPLLVFAQKKNNSYNYYIKRATSEIKIDGQADDAAWQNTQLATDFFQVLPMDTSKAIVRTEVRLTYDDKNLYVLFVNYNKVAGNFVVESMKRDFLFNNNDNDLLFIDTFNDQTNGFSFGSNAMGGQWDGLMSNGSNIDLSWENRWYSEATHDSEKWIWEAAIPFKTLRYKEGVISWGINFSRLDLKTNEKSSWTPIPRQFPTASLAYTGNLVWDMPPPKPGANIAVIPYVTGGLGKDFENQSPNEFKKGIGFDAKFGITSSMNLDVTVNPDFSQVDVDVQQTNLDRFELFFPERRQFFIENGDLFNSFGFGSLRPFFSRRIGLDAPIYYGTKVSGKLNKNLRIGALNTQSGKNSEGLAGSNYSVLAVQQKVFTRSNVGMIFVNRQTVGHSTNDKSLADYNRTLGLEYNLLSKDNQWNGKAFVLKTFSPLAMGNKNWLAAGSIQRNTRHISTEMQIEYVGKDVVGNEVGYIRRTNYLLLNPDFAYLFFPKSGKVVSHGPNFLANHYFNGTSGKHFEALDVIGYGISFLNRSQLNFWTARDYLELTRAFDPTNYVGDTLATGTKHTWKSYGMNFTSTAQKLLTYAFSFRNGGYYAHGERLQLQGSVGYRFQPYVAFSMSANFNHIMFGDDAVLPVSMRNNTYDLFLVGPRLDVTFSNKLFFTNFLQYNNQTNNVNLNTRFQWRYSPASDLFLVYTDNYIADTFKVRNRALVLKFTYWWNV